MKPEITVNQAIRRGHLLINLPAALICLINIACGFYFGIGTERLWLLPVSFLTALILAWIYWSITITYWRLWAFENVRNVHELKKRAIGEKLIWRDGSRFEKTEIRTSSQQARWQQLKEKFKTEDILQDDPSVPAETKIHYSRIKTGLEALLFLFLILMGLFALFNSTEPLAYVFSIAMTAGGAYGLYKQFRKMLSDEAQIVLNDKGIFTAKNGFHAWEDISNEDVVSTGLGKNTRFHLNYKHSKNDVRVEITDYAITPRKLRILLMLHRARHEHKEKQG